MQAAAASPRRPDENRPPSFRDHMSIVLAISQCLSAPLDAWWRKTGTVGNRHFGMHAMIGFFVIPIGAILLSGGEGYVWPIGFFVLGTAYFLALHKQQTAEAEKKGILIHSRYIGDSWLPGKEARNVYEPCATIATGFACLIFAPGLGIMLMISGMAAGIAMEYERLKEKAYLTDARDAYLEQQYRSSQFEQERTHEQDW